MNNIEFVYCFSKQLAVSEERYAISLNLFRESVSLLSQHYKCKIYTDRETYNDIADFNVPVDILNDITLIFVDDFKVHCLGLLKDNQILIDIDVLVYGKLNLDTTRDLLFDFRDNPKSEWYDRTFYQLSKFELKKSIHKISRPDFVPNIGFLKFNNKALLREYTTLYKKYGDIIKKDKNTLVHRLDASLILGQYLLGALLKQGNYSYFTVANNNTSKEYVHLSGKVKFIKQQVI